MATQFLSCKFKVHNPSRWRREVIDRALHQYTLAMQSLLAWSQANLDRLRQEGKYKYTNKKGEELSRFTDKSIAAVLPKPSEVQADIPSSAKEALVMNVAAMLASYLSLDESEAQETGFPVSRDPSPTAYPNALEEFCLVGADLEEENAARARLLRNVRGSMMPLHFTRSRDFALLISEGMDKFYLWMKLAPAGSDLARPTTLTGSLINLATLEPFEYRGKSAVLVPIEVGGRGWQVSTFIEPVLAGAAHVKAGKLTKEGDNYYIHISFALETPETYEPDTYLGVNRGIVHTLGYGVVDFDGNIVASGHSQDPFLEIKQRAMKRVQARQKRFAKVNKRDYHRQELDNIVHLVVNRILGVALEHRSALVLEDWHLDNVGAFYRSAYRKVNQIIEYKAKVKGVPVVKRKMWAAYASQICVHCGRELHRENGSRVATCLGCGQQEHVDEANGVNIARRMLYKKEDWGGAKDKPGNWREFHCSFANAADFRTKDGLREGVS